MSEERADRYLAISELHRIFNVPESTLRSWRDRFREYIPTRQGAAERRKDGSLPQVVLYSLNAYREIHDLVTVWARTSPSKSLAEVGRELARRHPYIVSEYQAQVTIDGDFEPVTLVSESQAIVSSAPPSGRGPHPEAGAELGTRLDALTRSLDALRLAQDVPHPAVLQIAETTEALRSTVKALVDVGQVLGERLDRQHADVAEAASLQREYVGLLAAEHAAHHGLGPWWSSWAAFRHHLLRVATPATVGVFLVGVMMLLICYELTVGAATSWSQEREPSGWCCDEPPQKGTLDAFVDLD